MKNALKRIQIEGFKTIRSCDLELRELNALIGANGAGKSNFISFFKMFNSELDHWIISAGGANSVLHRGIKQTTDIHGILEYKMEFGDIKYDFRYSYISANDSLTVSSRKIIFKSL